RCYLNPHHGESYVPMRDMFLNNVVIEEIRLNTLNAKVKRTKLASDNSSVFELKGLNTLPAHLKRRFITPITTFCSIGNVSFDGKNEIKGQYFLKGPEF